MSYPTKRTDTIRAYFTVKSLHHMAKDVLPVFSLQHLSKQMSSAGLLLCPIAVPANYRRRGSWCVAISLRYIRLDAGNNQSRDVNDPSPASGKLFVTFSSACKRSTGRGCDQGWCSAEQKHTSSSEKKKSDFGPCANTKTTFFNTRFSENRRQLKNKKGSLTLHEL
jgi:hypothetical protein